MAKFLQTKSNPISNMVAELNAILGECHFQSVYYSHSRMYELKLTELGNISKRYKYLATEGMLSFSDMFQYLNGILLGYRMAKQLHKL